MENKIIIGLVGRICAGKGTISDHLAKKYGAAVLSFSDPMREILRILHQDVNRPNLQKLSLAMRTYFGEAVFSTMIKGYSNEIYESIIVLDPFRRIADIEAFEVGSLITIGVTRNEKGRYESMLYRNREKSDRDITIEKFRELDTAESEHEIDILVAKADYTIANDGSIEELLQKVDECMAAILKK
jgi:dephospho-CoA kinase